MTTAYDAGTSACVCWCLLFLWAAIHSPAVAEGVQLYLEEVELAMKALVEEEVEMKEVEAAVVALVRAVGTPLLRSEASVRIIPQFTGYYMTLTLTCSFTTGDTGV